ncbi:TetR/AcrR family transcriptional regulator [Sporolactobacillus vineae]|uniref:TetR/AcrR family transcriptional regulator n=1 Tax=Sporolactobacillus vineae TaxID=444463 RepID=UPI000288D5CA|nr:TetR/AcrR family transcriptional regulator [Sporolactobacillus vineae]
MEGLDHFHKIPVEKQNKIIDAALNAFGSNGYKKTSAKDIAEAAGISKAMIFHYFGNKKALYLYLIQLCGETVMTEVSEKLNRNNTDFFERIRMAAEIKFDVLRKRPGVLPFLSSVMNETADEVKPEVHAIIAGKEASAFREKMVFEGMDTSKFKEGIDPKLILKMLIWMSEGYFNDLTSDADPDFDAFYTEFMDCLNLLKKACYQS